MRLIPAGDTAILVQFENEISPENNSRVQSLAAMISDAAVPGVIETIPTYSSLLVNYDPTVVTFAELSRTLNSFELDGGVSSSGSFVYTVPVCYGGEYGEDLGDVASHANLSVEETVERHSGVCYRIYMLGFLPGFAYLGGLDETIACPRLSSPRKSIAPGSVGIGGNQTGVYPVASPGGWRLIGKTPLKLYDPERAEPILYRAGDYIKFEPITPAQFAEISDAVSRGSYEVKREALK